jgi:hypothetical protein
MDLRSEIVNQMSVLTVGDWVQAVEEISEPDFMGQEVWVHAAPNGVGHVIGFGDDGWVNVFFEKTGTVCVCAPHEVKWIAGPETGRARP